MGFASSHKNYFLSNQRLMHPVFILLLAFIPVIFWLMIGRGHLGRAKTNGGWVQFIPAAISLASTLLKPKGKAAPLAPPVDLNAEAKKSIAGNLENQDSIEALLGRANTFNQDQNISLMEQAMPGYGALSKSLTETAQRQLDNPYDLPKDVEQNLVRLAGERGISAGTKGELNDFSLIRDFGINSLQYGQQNISSAQGITGLLASIAPKVNPLSPMAFYVTPTQTADVAAGNRSAQQSKNNADTAASNQNNMDTWAGLVKTAGNIYSAATTGGGE